MCKILLRSDDQWLNYSKAKFPSNLNCEQNTVRERVSDPRLIKTHDAIWRLSELTHRAQNKINQILADILMKLIEPKFAYIVKF